MKRAPCPTHIFFHTFPYSIILFCSWEAMLGSPVRGGLSGTADRRWSMRQVPPWVGYPLYSPLFLFVLALPCLLLLALGSFFAFEWQSDGGIVVMLSTLFIAILYYMILPRRFEADSNGVTIFLWYACRAHVCMQGYYSETSNSKVGD